MFQITRDPSSGSFIQCLAKITVMVFFVSIDMAVVSFTAANLPVVHVCTAQSRKCLCRLCRTHTHHGQICCHNTDYVQYKRTR